MHYYRCRNNPTNGGKIMSEIARTPEPPYYAVIFTSERTDGDNQYAKMADEMDKLAAVQPGFLGVESAREGVGITVSYWASLEAIQQWKQNERHLVAQSKGIADWYLSYKTRICKVERDYGFEKGEHRSPLVHPKTNG
jgi:heme-degrading monooxygenase HmoA